MHEDIDLARDIDKSTHVDLTNRTHAFHITTASVNLRDQVRHTDTSATPLQFLYEAADCRIFLVPETWYNYTNLWKYAADAIWQNPALCTKGSRTGHTQPTHPSAPGKPYNASSTLSNLADSQMDRHPSSTQHESEFILDGAQQLNVWLGRPCHKDGYCGKISALSCQTVSVCESGEKMGGPSPQKRCVQWCEVDNSKCPGGTTCQLDQHVAKLLEGRSAYGHCKPPEQRPCRVTKYQAESNSICRGRADTLTCDNKPSPQMVNPTVEPHPEGFPVLYHNVEKWNQACCCGSRQSVCRNRRSSVCDTAKDTYVCDCSSPPSECPVKNSNL